MSPLSSLLKNTRTYLVASTFAQLLVFGLWILLGRWLHPAQIGTYALAMFIVELFSAVSIFGLDATITRFYYAEAAPAVVLRTALAIFLAVSGASIVLFLLTAAPISHVIPGLSGFLPSHRVLFAVLIISNAAAHLALAHHMALRQAGTYARLQAVRTLSFVLLALLAARLGRGVVGVLGALLVSCVLTVALALRMQRQAASPRGVSRRVAQRLASYSVPLMLYSASGVVVAYFSRLLLDRYAGLTTLGVYGLFFILAMQVNGLWSSFNRAWTPEIFSQLSVDRDKAEEQIRFVAFAAAAAYLLGLTVVLIAGWLFLFRMVFGPAYLAQIGLLYILLLGPVFTAIYTATYPLYYYGGRTRRILVVSLGLSAFSFALTFVLTRWFGQVGAAVSQFVFAGVTTLSYLLVFARVVSVPAGILQFSLGLFVLMSVNVALFLLTSSVLVFLAFVPTGALLAIRMGGLWARRAVVLEMVGRLAAKVGVQAHGVSR